jgi:AcrR family transcriptional regulator
VAAVPRVPGLIAPVLVHFRSWKVRPASPGGGGGGRAAGRRRRGSLYWHFADRAELITATLELWEQRETIEVIRSIRAITDPRERLAALGYGAYAGAAHGNAHAAVLAAASDPRARVVLDRVTRTRLAFLEQLYGDLGLPSAQAARQARLAYALFLGIGELRRSDPGSDPGGEGLDAYIELAVNAMVPQDDAPA